jgi:site-specific recombinase XerD
MSALAPGLQAFFTDRLIGQRAASPNTIGAYKTSLRLLLGFAAQRTAKAPAALDIAELDAPLIAAFLGHLEADRHNSVATRNNRLAAVHSLFAYLALHHPEHAASIQRVLAIPPKRTERNLVTYLTDPEVDALLGACDQTSWTGRRDHAMFALWPTSPAKTSRSAPGPTSTPSAKAAKNGAHRWCQPREPSSRPGSASAPESPPTPCSRPSPAGASAATPSNDASPGT